MPKEIHDINTRALDFVDELIYYIFHVQDADDDNLSAELVCRKLLKHGLIDKVDGCYEPKDEPQTSCKTCRYGEVDEGYVRCAYYSKATEKTEPQTEYRIGYYTPTNAEILKALEDEQSGKE